jgi:hypothetical protein
VPIQIQAVPGSVIRHGITPIVYVSVVWERERERMLETETRKI